jgi:hypothetical protein
MILNDSNAPPQMTESKIQFSGQLQQNQMAHTLLLLHSSACSFRRILPSYSTKDGFVAFCKQKHNNNMSVLVYTKHTRRAVGSAQRAYRRSKGW